MQKFAYLFNLFETFVTSVCLTILNTSSSHTKMLGLLSLCLVLLSSCSGAIHHLGRPDAPNSGKMIDEGIVNFGLKLNNILLQRADRGQNVIFSPIGIYASLAMTHLGANGQTRDEIAKVLDLPDEWQTSDRLHENLGGMFKQLQDGSNAKVDFANGIFLQNGYQLKNDFQRKMQSYYQNQVVNVDFNSDDATELVNTWFSQRTHDKIQQFFEEAISRDTKLLLANALCFGSNWDRAFRTETTQTESFETEDGQRQSVNMMRKTDTVPYYCDQQNQYEAVGIPYKQNEYQMYAILPQQGQTLTNLSNIITYEHIQRIVKQSQPTTVDMKVPQMKLKTAEKIKEVLQQMGVNQLFDSPDLSNMIDKSNLRVSQVHYSLEIDLNEQGTDVCAGTAQEYRVHQQKMDMGDAQKQVWLQRPFMFFLYHTRTNCVLFHGNIHQCSDSEY